MQQQQSDGLATTMAEASRSLAAETDLEKALSTIVQLAISTVACTHASITLRMPGGKYQTFGASDSNVTQADSLQYSLNEGPCVDALWKQGTFTVEDVETDPRWPTWGPQAAALGLHSILSVHLFTSNLPVGALNMYSAKYRTYSAEDVEIARVVAAHASVALARIRVERDLWVAVDSRHLIGQAQGILMALYELNAEQSFSVLQRYSQRTNLKLRDVALQVVTTKKLPVDPASQLS